MTKNYYEILEVSTASSPLQLRAAYRSLARRYHPDIAGGAAVETMQLVNTAWQVLSDPESRRRYDATLGIETEAKLSAQSVPVPQPSPQTGAGRRKAWSAGVQAQVYRLALQSGRSATQTSLLRNPLGRRSEYAPVVEELAQLISQDIEARVRSARAAGAAPLDLGVAGTLVGIRCVADELRRQISLSVTIGMQMKADLLDRMWDVLAHELPVHLTAALGGNPQLKRHLQLNGDF